MQESVAGIEEREKHLYLINYSETVILYPLELDKIRVKRIVEIKMPRKWKLFETEMMCTLALIRCMVMRSNLMCPAGYNYSADYF